MASMSDFLSTLTDEQRAAFLFAARTKLEATPAETVTPKQAKAKAKANAGKAKPAPMPSDDTDTDETVPVSVSNVGATIKANGPTIKATPRADMIGPDTYGRSLPVSVFPVSATFRFPDGTTQVVAMGPKVFSTGSVGAHGSGKISIDSPDGSMLQANLVLTYCKPKGTK